MDNIKEIGFRLTLGEMERRFGCVPCVMLMKVEVPGLFNVLGPDVAFFEGRKAAAALPKGLTLLPGDLVILPVKSDFLTEGWARKAVPRTAPDDFRVETQARRYTWPIDRPEGCPWPARKSRR